jgi:hypothetical protein
MLAGEAMLQGHPDIQPGAFAKYPEIMDFVLGDPDFVWSSPFCETLIPAQLRRHPKLCG